ncbi:MAG: tannase/feruloyl esterase family alpha/beta hydrolase [Pseudomonadota bacterium]|nr:tannase/feruloyl esterase family alpha/beta hydrolase [Pseudomonadota bacterium]
MTAAQACSTLSGKTIAGATLAAATVAASGAVPTYCNVTGTIAPKLNFAIRLPDTWNGKLYYGGGGGYNGAIPGLNPVALTQGYAAVASDSGHQGSGLSADFALNDPFAAQLFGSLSVPTVMSTALEAVTAAYGVPPSKSYFEGCSNGGREALMNVQRYPNLFDGVIARAPAYNWVGFMGAFNRTAKALAAPGGALSAAKTALLASAVRTACDGLDGIVDGVVSNQAACTPAVFNPASLRCAGGADTGNTCLSDAQLAVVTSWTTDAVFSGSPTYRNAGWSLTGNEDDPGAWAAWETGGGTVTNALQYLFQDTTVKNYLARDPAANSLTYTPWDQNQNALFGLAALNDATNADIRPFRDSGAKLILWHGGNDPALSKNATIEYWNNVRTAVGGAANEDAFVRLYIPPGVNHCSGGPGADTSDLLTALDQWVVGGTAPGTLTAQKVDTTGAVAFSRPLCRYPQYPRYTGPAGDAAAAKLASNYTCT